MTSDLFGVFLTYLPTLIQGLLYRWTEHSADFFGKKSTGGGKKAPQITPRGRGGGFLQILVHTLGETMT